MVWRKAGNWTGFTDGYRTWVSGPAGLEARLNAERLPWENAIHDLPLAYRAAVRNAEAAGPAEVSNSLVSIVESNGRLVWRGEAGNKEVLVTTWTGWPGYNGQEGMSATAGIPSWVTAVPEVKEFCQAQRPIEPALRLEQLLGLPPDDGKQWFVELWVWPADLFRPAPDPEITDQGAGLDFPDSASPEYRAWFDDLRSKSYGENGYPWTRLGYTYDWGSPDDHVGLSEFVINKGAPIEVRSVTPTVVYCG